MAGWSDRELAAAVKAYGEMAKLHASGQPYSKMDAYRRLTLAHGRTPKSYEYRMQNISAVLAGLKQTWLPGLLPAKNIGKNVETRLRKLVTEHLVPDQPQPSAPAQARYVALLPAIRQYLIEVVRAKRKVTYGELMEEFGIDRFSLRHAMDRLGHEAVDNGEPVLTAVIVGKQSRRCSAGLQKEFGVVDDEKEREELFRYWQRKAVLRLLPKSKSGRSSITERAERFSKAKVRPDQPYFRAAVFLAYAGRCAITGCDIDKALDAAHKHGREWQRGHNEASDGVLLRKDLHALYDAGHLWIAPTGRISLSLEAQAQYAGLHGRVISGWSA